MADGRGIDHLEDSGVLPAFVSAVETCEEQGVDAR
jgi:hypothetical protein